MIYHEKRVRLPKPKYIVFYNGTKNQPDSMELRLSDCFENTDNEAPCLECTATMLNINYGHNQELMKHCRRLEEYSIFVQCVREYIQSEPSVEDALGKEIILHAYCQPKFWNGLNNAIWNEMYKEWKEMKGIN